jgi:hypothetical protein
MMVYNVCVMSDGDKGFSNMVINNDMIIFEC